MNNINIFFINISKFLKNIDTGSMDCFLEGKNFLSEKRKREFSLGRFLIKYVLKNFYDLSEVEVDVENNKPCIRNGSVKFSISHSNNMLVAAFCRKNIGVDIEFMKQRDFEKLFDYCGIDGECLNKKEEFYRYWTRYEAEIKLAEPVCEFISMKIFDDYMLSLAFGEGADDSGIKTRLRMYELVSPSERMNPSELINLKLVMESRKNENTVVAHEISTAQFDFR